VFLAQLLVKVPHVEVRVLLLVQPQHLLPRPQRHALRAGPTSPPVEPPVRTVLLVAPRQRRRLRTEIPKISAACHQVSRFALARKITSCTFIARSQASSAYRLILPPLGRRLYPNSASSGQITC
jgi:hypothetical protein